jgi:hypothetical protein
MPALLTHIPTVARAARASTAAPRRSRAARAAARGDAESPASTSVALGLGRRGAALGLGAAFLAGFAGGTPSARAVECNMVTPCMPGTEPGAPPRYVMPGPAYSPAEAAEERFRQKIQAERAAEKDAYETKFKREQAAIDAAEAAKTAEAAP